MEEGEGGQLAELRDSEMKLVDVCESPAAEMRWEARSRQCAGFGGCYAEILNNSLLRASQCVNVLSKIGAC